MRMPSPSSHQFSQVPKATIERSQFDRSSSHKTTFDAGYLIPFWIDEALPGDTFNVQCSIFARLATPLKPIMDNMTLETFFFAVPNRLVWENWQKFCGEQTNPDDSVDFLVPQMISTAGTGYLKHSLHDYFGLPTLEAGFTHSSLWHRSYALIYNEWFRDQNIQDAVHVDTDNGPDLPADYVLLRRGKRHDYFTSALPWPQKGEAVLLPLGSQAPITGIGKGNQVYVATPPPVWETDGTLHNYDFGQTVDSGASNTTFYVQGTAGTGGTPMIYADLSAATASTINELRQAFQIQKLLERDARGGTRYTEIVKAHFGVTSPDARLQRPEYLGGGSSPVLVSPISQTSSTDATTPQGNLAAIGTVSGSGHGFAKSFTEHCILIGLVCVRADLTYQQGLARPWNRQTRYDFYWPALSHIGEQAVYSKEIYLDAADPVGNNSVFGYQERYAEYRYKPSLVTGAFRSNDATSLDIWHLAQDFATRPTLSPAFIVEDPPVDRVIAVPAEPHFLFDSYAKCITARPMPVYGVPGLIDHF